LIFDRDEMEKILQSVKTKKKGTTENFFGFGFNIGEDKIYGTRGFLDPPYPDFTNNLYENKICEIKQKIN